MNDLTQALGLSASAMQAQAKRLRHVAENIANVDTPGYKRKLVSFQELADGRIKLGPVQLDRSDGEKRFDPTNPLADDTGHVTGSNVDLVVEIADSREAQRSYDANLRLFDQARQMTQSLFDLIRR